ncbi:rRNA accumulation-related protein [Rhizina undulata]
MSSLAHNQPTPAAPAAQAPALPPKVVAKWELGVALIFDNWKVLTDAVAGQWGGPDSADKRDWLCGAIADMFSEHPETDELDVEETLVHVMEDEFMVNVEDDSAFDVARQVVALRNEILEGNFTIVDQLHARFLSKPKNQVHAAPVVKEVVDEAGSSASEESESDEEMVDAPAPTPAAPVPRERQAPVVDEDGFELVQKRGSRRK